MPEPTLTIRNFRLRVTGFDQAEARRLGAAVACELGWQPIESGYSCRIGSLHLRLNSQAGVPPDQLASQIAAAIRRSLP